MLLYDRMILITECELKESGSNKIVEVTFLDLEDGKTYQIKTKNLDLLPQLNCKLNKLKTTLELVPVNGKLELLFTDNIENLGRV